VALTPEQLRAVNDPQGSGTGMPDSSVSTKPAGRPQDRTADTVLADFINQGLVAGFGINAQGASGSGSGNAKANRDRALKQLDIQKRRLMFQQRTGLRDIEQGRAKGLKGAINNALQRGIFRSGIRIENEAEVNRESDESGSDLRENIALSLESLELQREGVKASGTGGSGSRSSASGLIDVDTLIQHEEGEKSKAEELADAQNAAIRRDNAVASKLFDINTQTPNTGIVQVDRPPPKVTQR